MNISTVLVLLMVIITTIKGEDDHEYFWACSQLSTCFYFVVVTVVLVIVLTGYSCFLYFIVPCQRLHGVALKTILRPILCLAARGDKKLFLVENLS